MKITVVYPETADGMLNLQDRVSMSKAELIVNRIGKLNGSSDFRKKIFDGVLQSLKNNESEYNDE